jgi:hypothetical protein
VGLIFVVDNVFDSQKKVVAVCVVTAISMPLGIQFFSEKEIYFFHFFGKLHFYGTRQCEWIDASGTTFLRSCFSLAPQARS